MPPPATVGRFRVQRTLGSGGFATVHLAEDPQLESLVAVKILAENWAANADVHRRFVDEARLLRRVDSDHLVRVYDIGELDDGRPYFVMSYADGGTLSDVVKEHPPPWQPDDVLAVVDGIAAALTVLHRSGIVHRDVKPGNVLLRSAVHADRTTGPLAGRRVLLGDLGIAKDLQWASGLTVPAGSPAFMAPEQKDLLGRITPAADVHAFAMTVARLLGLEPPWPASPLGDALARATAFEVADRTATAAELAAELRGGLAPWRRASGANGAGAAGGPGGSVAPTEAIPVVVEPPRPVVAEPPRPVVAVPPRPDAEPPVSAAPSPLASSSAAAPSVASSSHPGDPRTPWSEAPAPPPRRRGRRLALLGGAVVVLAVAGLAAWSLLVHPRISPIDPDGFSVALPRGWDAQRTANVSYPGADDPESGRRASSGGRTITLGASTDSEDPDEVLGRVGVSGCGAAVRRTVQVGPWDGVTHRYRCPDGSVVDEVVVANAGGSDEFTVWVEVRSVDGSPDVSDVLTSLRVP